ncbi:MAG: LysR family transcriptional regulator [Hyphomicrobiaceae bacterium]|nr:LysR family transcriptional regulator [Hyphomicrobiaceae bacterium]
MTPAQARAFQAVALEGSFTKAALSLGVSQPTITTQVKQVETLFNVELFHRTKRGVQLTPTGAELLSIVRRMFGSYGEAVDFLQEVGGLRRGHLRVGSYGPYDVMRMLAHFSQRYPGVRVSVSFANSRDLTSKLKDYEIDVAVLGRTEPQPEFRLIPFSTPSLIIIAPNVPPWSTATAIRPAQLKDLPLVMRERGSAARQAFEGLLLRAGIFRSEFTELGSREGVVSAVAAGMGVSAIFDEGLLPESKVVRLAIEGRRITSPIEVACLRERQNRSIIRVFLETVRELLAADKALQRR